MGKIKSYITKSSKLLNYDFNHITDKQDETVKRIELLNKKTNETNNNINTLNNNISELNNILNKSNDEINKLNCKLNELDNKINQMTDRIGYIDEKSLEIKNKLKYFNIDGLQSTNISEQRKKILLCGFFGAFNLGDELMLQTVLREINEVGEFDITIMLCDNPQIDITRYGECKFIHYPTNVMDFNTIAINYDYLIFSGGALLDDIDYDNSNEITLGKTLVNLAMRFITFSKGVMLYGLSANSELTNEDFIEKLNFIINHCSYFSLRDLNSLNVLKKSGINVEKIKIVDDIVFANNFSDNINNLEYDKKNLITIGISYVDYDNNIEKLIELTKSIYNYLDVKRNKL